MPVPLVRGSVNIRRLSTLAADKVSLALSDLVSAQPGMGLIGIDVPVTAFLMAV
jgi:hypothetical protein